MSCTMATHEPSSAHGRESVEPTDHHQVVAVGVGPVVDGAAVERDGAGLRAGGRRSRRVVPDGSGGTDASDDHGPARARGQITASADPVTRT